MLPRANSHAGLNRRQFLALSGFGLAGASLSAVTRLSAQAQPAPAAVGMAAATSVPESLEIALTAAPATAQILPGTASSVLAYRGSALSGNHAALQTLPGSYPGPVLRVQKGQRLRVHLQNQLAEPTNIHWHGLLLPRRWTAIPKT